MTVLAYVIIAAITGAFAGTLAAYIFDAIRAEARRFDAGADRVAAQIEADRAQSHRAGRHARPGGHGDCLVCGHVEGGAS